MNPLTALRVPPAGPAGHTAVLTAGKVSLAELGAAGGLSDAIVPGSQAFGQHLRRARDASASAHGRRAPDRDLLHSAARQIAQLAPPASAAAPPVGPERESGSVAAAMSVEELWPALVRKAAWSGDARRGTVRLELGAGALAGATVLVQSDDGRVRVQLSAPPGIDLDVWRARIASRLAARGLEVERIDVD